MNSDLSEKIALFKYSIIAPLVSGSINFNTKKDFFDSVGNKSYIYVDGSTITLSSSTVERWYYAYINNGFDALKTKSRSNFGKTRKLDNDLKLVINHYIDTHPRLPATSIFEALIKNGYIVHGDVSLSTINRYVSSYKKNKDIVSKSEMKRYELEHINDVWCCDTSYSFKLSVDGVKKRTYIIAIIDDASRMIVGCDVFFNDNFANYMSVLKQAIKRYGKPKLLNVDNGAPYKNGQIELLCARLGTSLHHCAPYEPTGKAKIERWFRTMKDHFMAIYNLNAKTTIDSYRFDLLDYVNSYNNKIHSSLNGLSPVQRFFDGKDQILKLDPDLLDKIFLIEVERKVTADSIISLDSLEFEVPYKYANKKIKIRYSTDYKSVFVVNPDNSLSKIALVDKISNSKIKRLKPIFNIESGE